ncbi:stalk domain-containing protein [Paenibacillus sp. MBLB4367]|uniref:stalk domain-containing protein n=1 Tax=Paenibacillus sp. MBLB4367 TaxID=3384767 RepID=UPI003907FA0D
MRKFSFVTGLLVGVGISACTVAFASDSIQAFLFPSNVTIHMNGETKALNVYDEDPVINYNNKTYIPLRLFAESMGATVFYQNASPESGDRHQIDIFTTAGKLARLEDPEGNLSIDQLSVKTGIDQQNGFVSGIVTFHKDMTNKAIEIEAYDSNKNKIGATGEISVDGSEPWQAGDVRVIQAPLFTSGTADSYRVRVNDGWALTTTRGYVDGILAEEAGVSFGKGKVSEDGTSIISNLQFKNSGSHAIAISPLQIEYQILKKNGEKEEVVFRYTVPPLEGKVPAESWYTARLPKWSMQGSDSPGTYVARILVPQTLSYTAEGSAESKSIISLSKFTSWEYELDPASAASEGKDS